MTSQDLRPDALALLDRIEWRLRWIRYNQNRGDLFRLDAERLADDATDATIALRAEIERLRDRIAGLNDLIAGVASKGRR